MRRQIAALGASDRLSGRKNQNDTVVRPPYFYNDRSRAPIKLNWMIGLKMLYSSLSLYQPYVE